MPNNLDYCILSEIKLNCRMVVFALRYGLKSSELTTPYPILNQMKVFNALVNGTKCSL